MIAYRILIYEVHCPISNCSTKIYKLITVAYRLTYLVHIPPELVYLASLIHPAGHYLSQVWLVRFTD